VRKVKEVKAPMPGMVLRVEVVPGQEVQEGDPLLVLEAMKMENNLKSPASGTIKSVHVEAGKAVEKGAVLVVFA
jgi:biotin carboxyl carrier protein